ncbi:MAG: NAD(+) diphosphatase [Actinobacteria bacterium]|nr:NAD(+) diphosphatase [Actinomycetota bacterium]
MDLPRLEPLVVPPEGLGAEAHWVVVHKGHVVLGFEGDALPFGAEPPLGATLSRHFLGTIGGHGVWAVDIEDHHEHHDVPDVADGFELVNLRAVYGRVPEAQWYSAGRAEQIVQWSRTHQFCGRCGSQTKAHPTDRARSCTTCGLLAYPRLSPAVIMLVERDDGRALLAQGRQFPGRFFSTLAGFVEPGENLEDAVHREILEETNIAVTDVSYFGSQPWPFPNSLMLGFKANYESGDIVIQEDEIVEASWFAPDDLPPCPRGGMSIAGSLIDDWLTRSGQ